MAKYALLVLLLLSAQSLSFLLPFQKRLNLF